MKPTCRGVSTGRDSCCGLTMNVGDPRSRTSLTHNPAPSRLFLTSLPPTSLASATSHVFFLGERREASRNFLSESIATSRKEGVDRKKVGAANRRIPPGLRTSLICRNSLTCPGVRTRLDQQRHVETEGLQRWGEGESVEEKIGQTQRRVEEEISQLVCSSAQHSCGILWRLGEDETLPAAASAVHFPCVHHFYDRVTSCLQRRQEQMPASGERGSERRGAKGGIPGEEEREGGGEEKAIGMEERKEGASPRHGTP
eukprot:760210-Hanusia_phi.AAC.1